MLVLLHCSAAKLCPALCDSMDCNMPGSSVLYYLLATAAAAKSLQSCPTLCDPIDSSPPGSAIPRILQARMLEWIAISFSNAWKWKVKVKSLCRVWLFATPWTAAHQAPPSMGFSRQECWSGVPLPSPTSSWSLLKFMSTQSLMLSTATPLSSCPQSGPASGFFPVSWLFASSGQILEFQLQHQSFQWIFRVDFL